MTSMDDINDNPKEHDTFELKHFKQRPVQCSTGFNNQSGIGLIEVILAMLIFAFAALAAGNMQTISMSTANIANIHNNANNFAHEMLEVVKADRDNAKDAYYNIAFADPTPVMAGTSDPIELVADWRSRIANQLPDGLGEVICDDDACQVSIQWRQYSVTGNGTKTYSMKTSL